MRSRSIFPILVVAAAVLTATAWLRSAEYDEQYTLFIVGGPTRPVWPTRAFTAGEVRTLQAGHAGFAAIARELRQTDVHPPLYFWVVAAWRRLAGEGLFTLRLASVLFSIATLCVVALIARMTTVPAGLAMLLTLGCYGFTYTGTIARGFALAQLLTLSGVALLMLAERQRRALLAFAAGALLGAATFTYYLAAFVGASALLWLVARAAKPAGPLPDPPPRNRRESGRDLVAVTACIGFTMWLPADLWFFLAERHSRVGQFPPFDVASSTLRLARYAAANLLGGLPLYVENPARTISAIALVAVMLGLLALTIRQWRQIATPAARLLFVMAAAAPAVGLLLLGFVFNNTPIELRYVACATPFIGLLLAGAFAALPRRTGLICSGSLLAIQALALIGLMTSAATMQPARATAAAAASLAPDGVVLLPRGNDGVGIIGAFAIEAPPTMRLLVISRNESPAEIRARAAMFPRVVLALLDQDADSRETLPAMRQAFTDPCWRAAGEGFNVLVFKQICGESCPCSSMASH